jgi:glutamate-1-semialdehyde aminotransferase
LIQNLTELLQHRTHFHGHFDELEIKAAEEVIAFFPSIKKVGVPMKQPHTFVSGTLFGNTLFIAACYHVVSTISKTQKLTLAKSMTINSEQAITDILSRRKALSDSAMIISSAGVLLRMGRDFVSAAHTEADLDQYVLAYEKLLHVLGKRSRSY